MFDSWLTKTYVAHRGLFDNKETPENSLVAFEKAVQNNFGIELDVQMTSDGTLVVFHDDDMQRMTGVQGDIRETSYQEVSKLTLLNTQHKIPTFESVLRLINGKVPLIVEIKTHKNVGVVESRVLALLNSYKGQFCIESFNPFIVRWFKVNAPHIVRGQLADTFPNLNISKFKKKLLANLRLCRWNGSQFIAYNVEAIENNKAVEKWHKKIPLIVWTVKSQAQHDKLRHLYDNMIFDSFVPVRDDLQK